MHPDNIRFAEIIHLLNHIQLYKQVKTFLLIHVFQLVPVIILCILYCSQPINNQPILECSHCILNSSAAIMTTNYKMRYLQHSTAYCSTLSMFISVITTRFAIFVRRSSPALVFVSTLGGTRLSEQPIQRTC